MHLTKSDIILYIENALPEFKRISIEKHVRACIECARKLSVMQSVVSPYASGKIKPSRIMMNKNNRFYSRKQKGNIVIGTAIRKHPFYYAVASAAIITAAVFSFTLFNDDPSVIHASRVKGVVAENTKRINKGSRITKGSHLTTGAESHLALEALAMRLLVGSGTSFSIKKADIDTRNKKAGYAITVDKGLVSAEFDPDTTKGSTLTTPHAVITSKGSHIILQVQDDLTKVFVKSGMAVLEPSNGDSIEAVEGFSYIISEAVEDEEQSVEKAEMSDTDIPEGLIN